MFDQIKNLYNLRKQAEELQKQMGNEKFTGNSGSVTITINGTQELLDVQITSIQSGNENALANDFKKAFGSAQDQMKRVMAEKLRGMV